MGCIQSITSIPSDLSPRDNSVPSQCTNVVQKNYLTPAQTLSVNECLVSRNSQIYLILKDDANLCSLNSDGSQIVCLRSLEPFNFGQSTNPNYIKMESNGQVCTYDTHNNPIWCSTLGVPLTADTILFVGNTAGHYPATLTNIWSFAGICKNDNPPSYLLPGQELRPNECLQSSDETITLSYEGNGNLCTYLTSSYRVAGDAIACNFFMEPCLASILGENSSACTLYRFLKGPTSAYLKMQPNGELISYYSDNSVQYNASWSEGFNVVSGQFFYLPNSQSDFTNMFGATSTGYNVIGFSDYSAVFANNSNQVAIFTTTTTTTTATPTATTTTTTMNNAGYGYGPTPYFSCCC